MKWAVYFLSCLSVLATIIPDDRRIIWQGNVGVPGGITNRSVIFTNMTLIDNTGATDVSAAIQYALDHCPKEQVILLPAGTFRINSPITLKDSYTLRGAGRSQTIIDFHGSGGGGMICFSTYGGYTFFQNNNSGITVSAGYTKGSSIVTVSSTAGFAVGGYMMIDCLDDGTIISGNDTEQPPLTVSRGANRRLAQLVEVTSTNATTISFVPPLYNTYSNALSPQVLPYTASIKYAGVENLQVKANNTGMDYNFRMMGTAYCWLKNVESNFADGDHLWIAEGYRDEIRDSYFHDGYVHGPGSHDDTVLLGFYSSGCLVENNIMTFLHATVMLEQCGGGHVIGYNYCTNTYDTGTFAMLPDMVYHGSWVQMVLWEGNVAGNLNQDSVHGSSGLGTALRNVFVNDGYFNYTGPWLRFNATQRAISLAHHSYKFNIVGNLLGATMPLTESGNASVYWRLWNATRPFNSADVFSLGYSGGSDGDGGNFVAGDNTMPADTIINHGNWDLVTGTIQWSNNIADVTIPTTYYLAGAPAFFGTMPWPPFNPTNSTSSAQNPTNIPAGFKFFTGLDPTPVAPFVTSISGPLTIQGNLKIQ